MQRLALFDLDNTLLNGDSDYLWGRFLADRRLVDGEAYERENYRFHQDYRRGNLDIDAYLTFQLRFLSEHDRVALDHWHREFMATVIEPILLPKAQALLQRHREQGDLLVIITATNRFVTEPIARRLGVDHLLATELAVHDGRFTGRPWGPPCFQAGKVYHLRRWLGELEAPLDPHWFYSDSHNDLPLLGQVSHPVAVDPDDLLREHAVQHGWPILSLR